LSWDGMASDTILKLAIGKMQAGPKGLQRLATQMSLGDGPKVTFSKL
jgi:hypothetical protein